MHNTTKIPTDLSDHLRLSYMSVIIPFKNAIIMLYISTHNMNVYIWRMELHQGKILLRHLHLRIKSQNIFLSINDHDADDKTHTFHTICIDSCYQ